MPRTRRLNLAGLAQHVTQGGNEKQPCFFREVTPRPEGVVGTHTLAPETVLGLAHALFGARARGFVLGIRGYEFDAFGELLSEKARANLAAALEFITPVLRDRSFERAARG